MIDTSKAISLLQGMPGMGNLAPLLELMNAQKQQAEDIQAKVNEQNSVTTSALTDLTQAVLRLVSAIEERFPVIHEN